MDNYYQRIDDADYDIPESQSNPALEDLIYDLTVRYYIAFDNIL